MPRASKAGSQQKPTRGQRQTIPNVFCEYLGCGRAFKSTQGLTRHVRASHDNPTSLRNNSAGADEPRDATPLDEGFDHPDGGWNLDDDLAPRLDFEDVSNDNRQRWRRKNHPFLTARPCDEHGDFLPDGAAPAPRHNKLDDDWDPYDDKVQFRLADFAFRKAQISGSNINELLEIWAMDKLKHDDLAPFANADHLYEVIDTTILGDAPWKCLTTEPLSTDLNAPEWARQSYEIWYRDPEVVVKNLLDNPDFDGLFDYQAYIELNPENERRWSDFMSANYAWEQSNKIYENDVSTEGAMLCPLFFGADKTTVSVSTGNVEYHPGYMALGNQHSTLRRGHRNSVIPFVFLAIPKSDRKYDNDPAFRTFKRQLYHASWAAVLSTLKAGMTTPVVCRCPDGHFRRVIYDFGPFIADYPEQVLLAGVVQGWCTKCTAPAHDLDGPISTSRDHIMTEEIIDTFDGEAKVLWENYGINTDIIPFTMDFPRADIHKMLSPDLLHQLIKGTFKDHLVEWVSEYLYLVHEKAEAERILDEVDRRIAAVPSFAGLRRFKQGRRFKQWTGDDSKALMKAGLSAGT
ncbi:C2H2-type domain-containing protein [Mycena indigotica]|uniref:C2H2-type domain-containing protein n=1 Tax=Mycena indigotica TaxID=2126181 RepID=A0A8H6RXJ7_9AGAR|nr:C2H2-type domain-containing protein [Mycena indigotica]KAF7288733.1 C2H2-type domain-containing protein [Mycena indigotica]